MLVPKNNQDLTSMLEKDGKLVCFFTADWCPDCQFVYPFMPEIEASFPELSFVRVDRDVFMPLAQEWGIFGIPSFVVLENGQELARLVNKERKTKQEIQVFLSQLGREEK